MDKQRLLFEKYGAFLIFVATVLLDALAFPTLIYNEFIINIMLALLPMVFTILVISLSLPNDEFCGISNTDFRRIRRDFHYNFGEMCTITITLFVLSIIFAGTKLTISSFALSGLSIIYSILFLIQEVPILVKDRKYMYRVIKKSIQNGALKSTDDFKNSPSSLYNKLLFSLVREDGIRHVFLSLQGCDKDFELLDYLLNNYIDFLFKFVDDSKFLATNALSHKSSINALRLIDEGFFIISDTLDFNEDFNLIEIYKGKDCYYLLTRIYFCLRKICEDYKSLDIFEKRSINLMEDIHAKINYRYKRGTPQLNFLYDALNAIIEVTISNNELWFLILLRDGIFTSRSSLTCELDYFYFFAIVMFYYCCINKRVDKDFKVNIKNFLNEPANGLNSTGESFMRQFKNSINYISKKSLLELLPVLLDMNNNNKHKISKFLYSPKYCRSWSSSDGIFSNELIFDCWLEAMLCSDITFDLKESEVNEMLNSLSRDRAEEISFHLNEKWFDNQNFIFSTKDNFEFMRFYGFTHAYVYGSGSTLEKALYNFKENIVQDKQFKYVHENLKNEKELLDKKDKLVKAFNESLSNIKDVVVSKPQGNIESKCFATTITTDFLDSTVENYEKNFSSSFENIVYDQIKKDSSIPVIKLNKSNCNKEIHNLKTNNYIFKNARDWIFNLFDLDEGSTETLKGLTACKLNMPNFAAWKQDAIQIYIALIDEDCTVRFLEANEIDYIIDHDFKMVNGLYKYSLFSSKARTSFLTRNQLFEIIRDTYIYINIPFDLSISIKSEDIVLFSKKDCDD